jgi:hypothetical protein
MGIYKRRSDPLTSRVLGNRARCAAYAPSIIVFKRAFTWALTAVEDPRVGLFRHFSVRSDSSAPVHFLASQQSWGRYVAEPSVGISLMPFLSTAELGTESAAELQTRHATKLGVASQRSWGLPYGRAMGYFYFRAHY